jgi:hypothetical protein
MNTKKAIPTRTCEVGKIDSSPDGNPAGFGQYRIAFFERDVDGHPTGHASAVEPVKSAADLNTILDEWVDSGKLPSGVTLEQARVRTSSPSLAEMLASLGGE